MPTEEPQSPNSVPNIELSRVKDSAPLQAGEIRCTSGRIFQPNGTTFFRDGGPPVAQDELILCAGRCAVYGAMTHGKTLAMLIQDERARNEVLRKFGA